jgi:hypothetical protein
MSDKVRNSFRRSAVIAGCDLPPLFRIEPRRDFGRIDEIAEQDR